MSTWVPTIGICAAVTAVGWPWAAVLPGERLPIAGTLGLAYLAGAALSTLGLLLTTSLGLDVGRPALGVVAGVALSAGVLLLRRRPAIPQSAVIPGSLRLAVPFLVLAAGALTFGVVDAVHLGSPRHADFMNAWGVKGLAAFVDGNLDFAHLGDRWLYYPLNVSNLYAETFVLQGGADDSLLRIPGALFGVALAGVLWGFGRRLMPPAAAAGCVALVTVTPVFVDTMTPGLADMPLAAYLTVCTVAAYLWVTEGGTGWAALSGFAAGAAAWTKVEGLPLVLAVGLVAVVLQRHRRPGEMLRWVAWLGLFTLPWQLFMRLHDIPLSSTHFTINHTDAQEIVVDVGRRLASVQSWGVFWWFCAVVIAGTFPVWRRTRTRVLAALVLPNVVLTMAAWLTTVHPCVPCSIRGIGDRLYLHVMPGVALLTAVTATELAAAVRSGSAGVAAEEEGSPAAAGR